jgi:hypothetical protein
MSTAGGTVCSELMKQLSMVGVIGERSFLMTAVRVTVV